MSDRFILSVMGESEIETFEVQLKNKRMSSQVHDTIEDQVNWLGSILDVGADKNLTQAQKENIAYIAESFVLDNLKSDFKSYVLLLVLREKWPVGQKSKFKIRAKATPRHVPEVIIAVKDIPRTRSGKITELAVRDVIHNKDVKNTEALANPEALELFKNLPELVI